MRGNYSTHGYATRNHPALCAPMPKLIVQPAHTVLGWTAEQKAAWCLARDKNDLAMAEANYAAACAGLGVANKNKSLRRYYQGLAMRRINAARANLRAARAALAASLAAAEIIGLAA